MKSNHIQLFHSSLSTADCHRNWFFIEIGFSKNFPLFLFNNILFTSVRQLLRYICLCDVKNFPEFSVTSYLDCVCVMLLIVVHDADRLMQSMSEHGTDPCSGLKANRPSENHLARRLVKYLASPRSPSFSHSWRFPRGRGVGLESQEARSRVGRRERTIC